MRVMRVNVCEVEMTQERDKQIDVLMEPGGGAVADLMQSTTVLASSNCSERASIGGPQWK